MLGVENDPSAAIEVSLGGLPPKGGGSEGERRSGAGPDRGVGGLREALEMLASRAERWVLERVATLVQLLKYL